MHKKITSEGHVSDEFNPIVILAICVASTLCVVGIIEIYIKDIGQVTSPGDYFKFIGSVGVPVEFTTEILSSIAIITLLPHSR